MKKIFTILFVFLTGMTIAFISCQKRENNCLRYGCWIDDDTYRIKMSGVPNGKLTDREKRRKSSEYAAVLNAQFTILENFKAAVIESGKVPAYDISSQESIAAELEKYIKNGSIISTAYEDNDNANIIYEVKAKDLKMKLYKKAAK